MKKIDYEKEERKRLREKNKLIKREKGILKYMIKYGLEYHHHNKVDLYKKDVIKMVIEEIDRTGSHEEYNSYIWNYQGEGNNYIPRSQFGCRWSITNEYETIYDVPLDGRYKFVIYDSGERGLGSFNYIKVVMREMDFVAPKVNPGGIIPITTL